MDKSKKTNQASREYQQPPLALQLMNRYFRWVLILVIAIAIFIAYTMVIDKQVAEVRDIARESLVAKEQTLNALKEIKLDLDDVVKKFGGLVEKKKNDLALLDALLPRVSAYGDLYTIVDQVSARSGLALTNITIAFEDEAEAALQTAAAGTPPSVSALVKKMTLHISVEGGTYEIFKQFLENLEKSIPLFDIESLSFDGGAYIPNEKGETPIPHYDIELSTYYQS